MPVIFVTTDETTTQNLATGDVMMVSQEASIIGPAYGIAGASDLLEVNNTNVFVDGEILSVFCGVLLGSNDGSSTGVGSNDVLIGSTGTITSLNGTQNAILLYGSANNVVNDGTLNASGNAIWFRGENAEVNNSGTIISTSSTAVSFSSPSIGGTSYVTNSGLISGSSYAIRASQESLNVINTGTLEGQSTYGVSVASDGHTLTLVNHGIISTFGTRAISATDGDDTVTNTGTITGDVALDDGANSFTNAGQLIGWYRGGINDDTVVNSGLITSNVSFSSGDDVYQATGSGSVGGTIFLDQGNDTATLGSIGGRVLGGNGDDTITGGTGSDDLRGDIDDDLIRGRGGDDYLEGGSGNDTLRAGQGDDEIDGGSGDDSIRGGAGEDIITGGEGLDNLFGGTGADTFIYLKEDDSPDNNTKRDIIQDFTSGEDLIDLSAFTGLSYEGNSGFAGGGSASFYATNANAIGRVKIFVDINGDGIADMKIVLNNTTTLTEDDFIF